MEKRDTYRQTCAHVLFKGEKESIVGTRRESKWVPICLAREFRGGGQNGTQLLDAPSVRLRFICLIIKILARFVLLEFTSPETVAKLEDEVHMHGLKLVEFSS